LVVQNDLAEAFKFGDPGLTKLAQIEFVDTTRVISAAGTKGNLPRRFCRSSEGDHDLTASQHVVTGHERQSKINLAHAP
jgi:hypothetical protein